VTEAAEAPRKLFREEAATSTVACLSCGGPIELRGFGAVERVSCPYCGSVLAPEESGALSLLQQAQRQRRQSILPLHARGKLDGTTWEIIGIVWRYAVVDGTRYPWQEFLLYNPYRGYRWLIFSMSDGHWSWGGALQGAPRATGGMVGHRFVDFDGVRFKHFQSSTAITDYVEGEFPWQVQAGDQAVGHEYVAPPSSISVEETHQAEGQEVTFTSLSYLEPRQVWSAFGLAGSPPPTSGVGSVQPNPWRRQAKPYWLSFAALVLAWIAATAIYVAGRETEVVVDESNLGVAPFSTQVEIGEPGEKGTLDFTFAARPLSNSWAYAEALLVAQDREDAVAFGVEVDEWHGISDGERWREGSQRRTVTLGGIEGGSYLLQVTPQVDPKAKTPVSRIDIRLRDDVVLARYIAIPLLVIIAFPLLNLVLGLTFEGRRWQGSDYAGSDDD
jgi:hypothetical protein